MAPAVLAPVASALLNPVCDRVINFAIDEYQRVRNLEEEIEKLKTVVSLIKGVLHDAEEKQVKEEAVRGWLRSLKQVLFNAEDILDEVATDAILQRGQVRNLICNIICCCGYLDWFWSMLCVDRFWSKRAIAHQINDITLKLDDMYKARNGLGLQISWPVESRPSTQPHTSSLLADESYIMGRDGEREKMTRLLLGSEGDQETESASRWQKGNVRVLTIDGMGGVGKTTLAQLAFNDPMVTKHFQLMMWVCVSEDFDLKRITREMLEVACPYEEKKELFELSNWDVLQRRVKDKIQDRRFLLVLDDMWEEDHGKWETLCGTLASGREGSRLVVTTREKRTRKMVNGTPIPLEPMSSEELWPIFRRYAFGGHESSKMIQLEIVGRQIVEKLGGLPLAAKVIGRLLNERLDINHWTGINLRCERFTLQQQSSDSILRILKLSYDRLSVNSKQCFAYCSLFPKDHIILKDELIQMWVAQNFIQMSTRAGFHVEKAGYERIDDLLYKSLLEKYINVDRKFYMHSLLGSHLLRGISEQWSDACTMHDLIHDLAESVAEDDCLRLGDKHIAEIPENVCHVSIATENVDVSRLEKLWQCRNLRTLLFLRRSTLNMTPYLDDLFMRLKRLRVLGLQGCRIRKLPSSVGKLKQLRFMDLSDNLISTLPETCSELHNLQVLNLKGCRWLGALPRNTSALVNLRHLQVDTEVVSTVQGLGKLTALQELIVTGSNVQELADMGMLKRLRIWRLEEVVGKEDAIQARLEAKEHLEMLELSWRGNRCSTPQHSVSDEEVVDALRPVNSIRQLFVGHYEGVKSPRWMEDPSWVSTSFLERIELRNCNKWEVLPPLSQLRCLKFLTIGGMHAVELIGPQFFSYYCEEGGGGTKLPGFPSLEELVFWGLGKWKEWEAPPLLLPPPPPQLEGNGRGLGQQQPVLFLPRLRVLSICSCPALRVLPPLPHTLTHLRIEGVGLIHLPGWMGSWPGGGGGNFDAAPSTSSSSSSLSSLRIENCPSLTSLGGGLLQRHPLRTLKELEISACEELTSLPDRPLFRHLTSLESLTMTDCPKLSWPPSATEEDALPPSLKRVQIHGCGDMMAELLLASLRELTSLSRLAMDVGSPETWAAGVGQLTSLRHLGIKGNNHVDDGALSTCLGGGLTTSLKSLSISNCSAVTTALPPPPPPPSEVDEALSRRSSLQILEISNCMELRSLGFSSQSLLSIEEIEIENCPKLLHLANEDAAATSPSFRPTATSSSAPPQMLTTVKTLRIRASSPEQIAMWLRQCPSLQMLDIWGCPQLITWSDDDGGGDDNIHLAPSLRLLDIMDCENLRSLPSSLRGLSSLEDLTIVGCPKIQRLPSAGLPEALERFYIRGCPELADRCGKEGCPDWPLISHIPLVRIED